MNSLKRNAILSNLARNMRQRGSWCGETHLQKALYLLQDLAGVSTDMDFILYKHGPFSFDLRDTIAAMRADELFELKIQPQPYGAKLIPMENATYLEAKFPNTLGKYQEQIEFVADEVADKGVSELERLATALFLARRELVGASADDRAKRLCQVKPHIPYQLALEATEEIDRLLTQAKNRGFVD
jgi:hypothetical protein